VVPTLNKAGRSFKGAAAYFLHDKREEGQAEALTADRVAWTETVNLPGSNAERAWRMMAMTAMAQGDLKAAAGVKATGRKLTSPVQTITLSWHPSEKPDREQMMEAAREALAEIGMADHQAMVVAHRDTKHPHLHILVNRVHPQTGVAATLSKSKLKLSEWAQKYEERQGQILCPKRVENNLKRQEGEKVAHPRKDRKTFEQERELANDNLSAAFVRGEQKRMDAALKADGRRLHDFHRQEWDSLEKFRLMMAGNARIVTDQLRTQKREELRENHKAQWRNLYERQREERDTFQAAERGFLSKLWSFAFVYQSIRQNDPKADALTIFYTLMSSARRREMVDHHHERERNAMHRQHAGEEAKLDRTVRKAAAKGMDSVKAEILTRSETLRQYQAERLDKHRQAWRQRNEERKYALSPHRRPRKTEAYVPRFKPAPDIAQSNVRGKGMQFEP